MRVVEARQYFVTEDTSDFRQVNSVVCREYTLPRDDPDFQPKGWIQGNMRIRLALEVTTSFQHFFKNGIEIRIESVNKDSSHSWVTISHGTFKHVIDSIEEEKSEIFAGPQEEQIPQTSTSVVRSSKRLEWRFLLGANCQRGTTKPHVATGTRPDRAPAWWQQMASTLVHEHYRETILWPSLNPTEQAQVLSQSGPLASVPLRQHCQFTASREWTRNHSGWSFCAVSACFCLFLSAVALAASLGRNRLWPNRRWPSLSDRLWPNRLWPNRLWPKLTLFKVKV